KNMQNAQLITEGIITMKQIFCVLLITFIFLSGCIDQKELKTIGNGEYWRIQMSYNVTSDHTEENGSITYKGDDKIKRFYFEFQYPDGFGSELSGERNEIDDNKTTFNIGRSIEIDPEFPSDTEYLKQSLNNTTVLVEWETNSGEKFKEVIELKEGSMAQ
ncbi:hypothetical protein P4475_02015, partial [Halalkalibacterium halodurans]|uniref:hypothetical protein n=1 Tax=Halalkalibacterium halodurans TaxID=86665 RepID=UPI002E1C1125|nr:hypothetical protein [Halalkalibacterium halodurans]